MRSSLLSTFIVATALVAGAPDARAYKLGLALMDARQAGLKDDELAQLQRRLHDAMLGSLKGSDFVLVPADQLAGALKEMPSCKPGTCDMQVGRRTGAAAVVSVEFARVRGEYSMALRMFETKEGVLLGRASATAATLGDLDRQVPAGAEALDRQLRKAHAAALAAKATGEKYQLRAADGTPAAWTAGAATAGTGTAGKRRVIEDGEQVHLEDVLHPARPGLNACFEVLLAKKKKARGRMVVVVDVEAAGQVSRVEVAQDELANTEMEGCVAARFRRLHFAPLDQPWQIRFPLVFVPAGK